MLVFHKRPLHRAIATLIFVLLNTVVFAHERRVNSWLVCGTFPSADPSGFAADFIGEANVRPTIGATSGGKPWLYCDDRLYCRNLDDYVDLYTFFNQVRPGSPAEPTDGRVAYAHTYVWSPSRQTIQMLIGANDGYEVWLNGGSVGSAFSLMRQAARDEHTIEARLEGGWNRLLVKVQNGRGIWGFYLKLAGPGGQSLDGLEYSVDAPDGPLTITTTRLPRGYTQWPYVWLTIRGVKPAPRVPSASPFRLMAKGGRPPYRWSIPVGDMMPTGLYLDGMEGEIRGVCGPDAGEFAFTVQVEDASGATARRRLVLEVAERPNRWVEEARIGGLIHGSRNCQPPHGDPKLQARLMAREGYGYAAQTSAWWARQELRAYAEAFRSRGIRFGCYIGLPDGIARAFGRRAEDYWPSYLDFLHTHLQALCLEFRPAVLYLDGIRTPYKGTYDWELDAIFSLVKTLTPECLLLTNSNDDFSVGDCDFISWEGHNDRRPYWSRWPRGQSGLNPKYMPVETWRFPFAWSDWEGRRRRPPGLEDDPDYLDWKEWARVMVSLIGEGYICNLDHSLGAGREEMHEKLGDWLAPRLDSLIGTYPAPLREAQWGYQVVRGDTIYLHILANPRGKTGWTGEPRLTVGPLDRPAKRVYLVPELKDLAFHRKGNDLVIETAGIEPDPVDTIVAIELGRE